MRELLGLRAGDSDDDLVLRVFVMYARVSNTLRIDINAMLNATELENNVRIAQALMKGYDYENAKST